MGLTGCVWLSHQLEVLGPLWTQYGLPSWPWTHLLVFGFSSPGIHGDSRIARELGLGFKQGATDLFLQALVRWPHEALLILTAAEVCQEG